METSYGIEEEDALCSVIFFHKSENLYMVEIWDACICYIRIFVTAAEKDDFFAKWYLGFLVQAASLHQADSLVRIARTLTAFVRHGTEEPTIDERAERTLDDDRRWQEGEERWRRKEKV